MADLRTIWVDQVERHLGIKAKEFDSHKAFVIIPDLFKRQTIKQYLDILLHDLGFCAAMCHVDSVCTTFGAGIATACVVNIGHSTTSVCCVEDGISLSFTRVQLDYGGSVRDGCAVSLSIFCTLSPLALALSLLLLLSLSCSCSLFEAQTFPFQSVSAQSSMYIAWPVCDVCSLGTKTGACINANLPHAHSL